MQLHLASAGMRNSRATHWCLTKQNQLYVHRLKTAPTSATGHFGNVLSLRAPCALGWDCCPRAVDWSCRGRREPDTLESLHERSPKERKDGSGSRRSVRMGVGAGANLQSTNDGASSSQPPRAAAGARRPQHGCNRQDVRVQQSTGCEK